MEPRLTIIAHRGASKEAPENTLPAVRRAVKMGVDAIEVDVRLTLDGQPILLHDETLDRTTNSAGSVAATPARKFQNVDAGSWFHPQFAHERVPLLSEFLAAVPASIWINLHVKPDARCAEPSESLMTVLNAHAHPEQLLISTDETYALQAPQFASFQRALITDDPRFVPETVAEIGCKAWHPDHKFLTPKLVARAVGLGLQVNTWTVDDPKRAQELMAWGVDGIFTNDIAAMLTMRAVTP